MLNRPLYARLAAAFGEVEVVNENQPIRIDDRPGPGRMLRWKTQSGEQYRVNCPCCGDTRMRLYISYAWGMDSKIGYPASKLIVCHNEHCEGDERHSLRRDLERLLGKYFSDVRRGIVNVPKPVRSTGADPAATKEKLPFPKPEWSIQLDSLTRAQSHVATYFRDDRGFDLSYLKDRWGVVYAYDYPVNYLGKDYSWLAGRVFIPVYHHEKLVGWQARITEDNAFVKQKYFNCPGWQKGASVYNVDVARQFQFGLLVEGVTDVWRVGDPAFCTFGKTISPVQEDIIAANWQVVGVMYDPDTDTDRNRSAEKALIRLGMKVPHVFRVNLPDARDPANCSYDMVWDCIERDGRNAAEKAKISLRRP